MFLNHLKPSSKCFVLSILTFFSISAIIFHHVFLTSNMIIDEEFHLYLGKAYCKFDFFVWNPKVTTLPGLYLVSSLIMGPFKLCSTYWLRFVSLMFSIINILLFYILFAKYEKNEWGNILSSVTLALLPPLYFFSHVYYTDVVSLTMILLMLVAYEKDNHHLAACFATWYLPRGTLHMVERCSCAVLCRQTNIIWVGFVAGRYVFTELYFFAMNRSIKITEKGVPVRHLRNFATQLLRQPKKLLLNTTVKFWLNTLSYSAVMLIFLMFLTINGGIVVGDKTAHKATIHVPQLFYFSLFSLVFAWPHFVGEVLSFFTFTRKHQLFVIVSVVVGAIIVYLNTQVHPYMLADNRHYMFYIWNRFFGRYPALKYFIVPMYVFACYVIVKLLYDRNDVSFLFMYLICGAAVLITQKLIEVRYFFVPYILFRLRIKSNANSVFNIILEFVTYLLMNFITLNVFFTKTIFWSDFPEPQRIIW